MYEESNLWEYADLTNPCTVEATKDRYHAFGSKMNRVGNVTADIKTIRLSSGGLPILPLRPVGKLEGECRTNPASKFKANIHIVGFGGLDIGYLICDGDDFQVERGVFRLNGDIKNPVYVPERILLDPQGRLGTAQDMPINYFGVKGNIEAHGSTISPRNLDKYPFSSVCFRDYLSF